MKDNAYLAVAYHGDGTRSEFISHTYSEAVLDCTDNCDEGDEIKVYEIMYDSSGKPFITNLVAVFTSPMNGVT
jgi:hypothetical protein